MKLFEASWSENYENFERYYDTNLKKSVKNKIDNLYEWYEPLSSGLYSYILDENIKLDKKLGNAKQGREHYGFLDPIYKNIRDNYWNKNLYNYNPNIWFLDIETRVGTCSTGFPIPEKALEPISLIQIYDKSIDTVIMLGLKDWKHKNNYKLDYNCKYIVCKDELHLINSFLELFNKLDPLIVYAWNGAGFDFPYIFNRLKNLNIDVNKLSNYGKVSLKSEEWFGKLQHTFTSNGHFFIDLMEVYKNFVFAPRASYSLDFISEVELGENKVDHSEYSTFDDFYTGNYNLPLNPTEHQKQTNIYQYVLVNGLDEEAKELAHSDFCYYGYKDPILIYKLDKKLNFTALQIMIADKMGVQIGDATGTIKPWSQFLLNKSYLNNQIMPPKHDNPKPDIIGGYVRNPKIGKHKWILSADVNSMYPLLGMVGFNMSPETFVPKYKLSNELRDIVLKYFNNQIESERFNITEKEWDYIKSILKRDNISLGINGATFTKEKLGIIPELVEDIYSSRKQAKKDMFKYQRQKVLIKEILNERNSK